jgi:PAS domain S-box-containing protein
VTYMNPVAENLTAWSAGEAYGRALEDILPLFHRDTQTPLEIDVRRVLDEGVVIELAPETLLRTRAGRELAIADSMAPLRDKHNAIIGMVLVFRDVTAQR